MKVKSALQHSIGNAKVMAVILPITLILLALFPNTITAIIAGVTAFTLVGHLINIVYIKRKARNNPEFLEEKIK